MAVATVGTTSVAASGALRRKVRTQAQDKVRRLRGVSRRALVAMLDDGVERDGVDVPRALAILDYHIAALEAHLATAHEPHPEDGVCPNCCVLLDRGAGPEWLLLAALPEQGLPVIASDSALGRALIGARPGQDFIYPTPAGPQIARLLAMELSPGSG